MTKAKIRFAPSGQKELREFLGEIFDLEVRENAAGPDLVVLLLKRDSQYDRSRQTPDSYWIPGRRVS